MHTAVADDDNDLSVSLLSSGWYTLRTHCDTLHKSKRAVVAVCARSAASWRRALSKLGAAAASATEHDDVKTVKPAVAAASCAVVALPRCSGDEGVRSGARERCPAAAATKACVAALASGARLIPEKPAA